MGSVYVPHGLELLPVPHDTCFRWSIAPAMFISVEFFTLGGMGYAHIMMILEEQYLMYWLDEHLAYDEDQIIDDAINEGGELLQLSAYQFLEDKQHFGGEDCNIPTYAKLRGIHIFVLFSVA